MFVTFDLLFSRNFSASKFQRSSPLLTPSLKMAAEVLKLCYNKGCGQKFKEDENNDGKGGSICRYNSVSVTVPV